MERTITFDLFELLGSEDEPRQAIINAAARMLVDRMDRDLITEIRETVCKEIRAQVSPQVEWLLHTPFIPTDPYGNAKSKEPKTLAEIVVQSAEQYLTEKVDSQGKTGYGANESRIRWIAKEVAAEAVRKDLNEEIAKARAELTAAIKARMAAVLSESITNVLAGK